MNITLNITLRNTFRLLVGTLAIAPLALPMPQAAAQNPADMNVDQMIKQLEGMPGSEKAIAELKRRRHEIEGAQKQAREAQTKQDAEARALPPVAAYSKPYDGIFALIPAPPKSVEEADARLGLVLGNEADRKSERAAQELDLWAKSIEQSARQLGSRYGQPPSSPEEIRVHQSLTLAIADLAKEIASAAQGPSLEVSAAEARMTESLKGPREAYARAFKLCDVQSTEAQLADCTAKRKKLEAAQAAAEEKFMKEAATGYLKGEKPLRLAVGKALAKLRAARNHLKSHPSPAIASTDLQMQQMIGKAINQRLEWNNELTRKGANFARSRPSH